MIPSSAATKGRPFARRLASLEERTSAAPMPFARAKLASAGRFASAPPPARASSCLILVPAPLVAGNQQEKPRLRSRTRAIHCFLLRFPCAPPGPVLHSQVVIGGLVNHHPGHYLDQLLHGS